MPTMTPETFQFLALVAVLLAIGISIAWIVLPFAVFGIKPLLRELIEETKKTNALLRRAEEPRQRLEPHL